MAEQSAEPGRRRFVSHGIAHGDRTTSSPEEAYGANLGVWFIDKVDQIHLKLYAAVDQGGRHVTDLVSLSPTDGELVCAARWAMTHDVSLPFRESLVALLGKLGHAGAADAI